MDSHSDKALWLWSMALLRSSLDLAFNGFREMDSEFDRSVSSQIFIWRTDCHGTALDWSE